MITDVLDLLRCPACVSSFVASNTAPGSMQAIQCENGHSYDIAKQGFVTLLRSQRSSEQSGDTAEMVDNRIAFLGAGYYDAIAQTVSEQILSLAKPTDRALAIADLGAGPGYYAAFIAQQALEKNFPVRIVALDNSLAAAKRAAKVDPAVASIRGDTWDELPFMDESLDAAMIIFAPLNMTEIARVLKPGGMLVVVTPEGDHLKTLRQAVPMLSIPEAKDERLRDAAAPLFVPLNTIKVRSETEIPPQHATKVILMGPSAFHTDLATLNEKLADKPTWTLDLAVTVSTFRKL